MLILRNSLLVLFVLPLLSCHRGTKVQDEGDTLTVEMPEIAKEIYIPSKIWDAITGLDFDRAVRQASSIVFAPIGVRLEERTSGVLPQPVVKLNFPKAGGEIDFANYIKAERGTLAVYFTFDGMADPENLNVFYVSKTKKRKIDNEVFGSGCASFYNVKNYIVKQNAKDGLVVNVTRDRHDSALGGYFVFGYKKDKQTQISAVRFLDSKRSDLFCEEVRK